MSKKSDRWIPLTEKTPKRGEYLVACDTDNGKYVTVLEFDGNHWLLNYEPTYCLGYYLEVTHWREKPKFTENESTN
jgi:hypothetical protein